MHACRVLSNLQLLVFHFWDTFTQSIKIFVSTWSILNKFKNTDILIRLFSEQLIYLFYIGYSNTNTNSEKKEFDAGNCGVRCIVIRKAIKFLKNTQSLISFTSPQQMALPVTCYRNIQGKTHSFHLIVVECMGKYCFETTPNYCCTGLNN